MPIDTRVQCVQDSLQFRASSASAVAVPVRAGADGAELDAVAAELSASAGVELNDVLANEGAKGSAGEVVTLPLTLDGRVVRCLLLGVGDGSATAYRRAGAVLARRLQALTRCVAAPGDAPAPGELHAFVEAFLLASYTFGYTTSGTDGEQRGGAPADLDLLAGEGSDGPSLDAAVSSAAAAAQATALARDLANTPASTKSPQWLVEQAAGIAADGELRVNIRDEDELRAEGFGGILAVGAGSAHPPRLIELSYEPARPRGHVVLVGKGITFDSGGLSLKPNDNMTLMKTDMAGGGAVLAVLGALRGLQVPWRVTGLVAAAENMPSGSAMRPGDVITHYGGHTVEVFNTDAEGRLVLADALAYARDRLAADTVVDIATLTGAATVALGRTHGALYATDDTLAGELESAGQASGERLWRMPLASDYRPVLDSEVADLAHIARPGPAVNPNQTVGAGSVVAALFLREFVGNTAWAHLDIAGPARASADSGELTKGATGFGARVLLRWLSGNDQALNA